MTVEADRIEALIHQRIEQNLTEGSDEPRPSCITFKPFQMTPTAVVLGKDYLRNEWALAELLQYYDRKFVQHAYLVLLKRDADIEGLDSRLTLLHTGQVSRVEVLFRLRYGPEGKQHKTVVKGLARAFLIERACRIPVLGIIPRYLRALLYLPRMQNDIEQLRGLIAMHKNEIDDRDQSLVDFQNEQLANIVRRLKP